MSGRRGLLLVLLGCVAVGVVVLIAAGRVWRRADLVAATGAHVTARVTGHAAEPALPALAIALIVLAGGVLAARGWLRRVVGLIVVAVGGAVVALAIASRADVANAITRQAFAVSDVSVGRSLSGWGILTLVAGALAALCGGVIVVVGSRWPALGSRYDAPAARRADPLASDWEALDRGEDPTV